MGRLHGLSAPMKWRVTHVINRLLGFDNWVAHDTKVVELGDFEISPALWLFKVGVREIALAIVTPRTALEIALACEQDFLPQNTGNEHVELYELSQNFVSGDVRSTQWSRRLMRKNAFRRHVYWSWSLCL